MSKPAATSTPELAATAAALVRIRHVRFNTKGMIISSPKEAEEQIAARGSDEGVNGYDIWHDQGRRAFRFDRYDQGKLRIVKWVPESNVYVYEEWDQPSSAA